MEYAEAAEDLAEEQKRAAQKAKAAPGGAEKSWHFWEFKHESVDASQRDEGRRYNLCRDRSVGMRFQCDAEVYGWRIVPHKPVSPMPYQRHPKAEVVKKIENRSWRCKPP